MNKFIWVIVLLFSTEWAFSGVYKWTDANGNTHFSDKKPAVTSAKELKIKTYTQATIDDVGSVDNVSRNVVMYSTDWCGYCRKARKYFRSNNITFIDYDIEKDDRAKKRYDKLGGRGVPVILVGNKRMNGFSKQRFESIYKESHKN